MLMDVRLLDSSGIDACRTIRAERVQTKVIMLSSFAEEEAVLESIIAGASGTFSNRTIPAKLIDFVQKAASGASLLDPAAIDAALAAIRRSARDLAGDGLSKLSPQEGKILRLIAEGKTNREIARILVLSEHTVRTYISTIFQKLHISRRSEAAAVVAHHRPDQYHTGLPVVVANQD